MSFTIINSQLKFLTLDFFRDLNYFSPDFQWNFFQIRRDRLETLIYFFRNFLEKLSDFSDHVHTNLVSETEGIRNNNRKFQQTFGSNSKENVSWVLQEYLLRFLANVALLILVDWHSLMGPAWVLISRIKSIR